TDETRPDYEFWDRLRRGKAKGYSLGGLFSTRIEQIFASWVLGGGVTVALADGGDPEAEDDPRNYTDAQLAAFLESGLSALMTIYRDHLGLGDQYVVVNADGTLSVPSPDTVRVERDPLDYRMVTAVELETRTGEYTIVDRYEPDVRTVTVKRGVQIESVTRYQNLIGRIPVVHLAHGLSANETNGHSIHETLKPLYDQYDDVIYKQLDGAKIMGNPLLTFEGLEDINAVKDANDPVEDDIYTDKDGNAATRFQLKVDQNTVLLVGKGGSAKYISPPVGFSEDTRNALKSLFLMVLDHTGIPEFIWGNEVASGRSSTEVQLQQWTRDIQARQGDSEGWLLELCGLWLAWQALIDPRLIVDELAASWPDLVGEDPAVQMQRIQYAHDQSLITAKTALELLNLVDDPQREVERAQEEAKQRREEMFPDGDTMAFRADLMQANQEAGA
ncbi:MAG: phage portal protein, partial [Pseudomonadota bacterium]